MYSRPLNHKTWEKNNHRGQQKGRAVKSAAVKEIRER
jgi:hypothetical protein